LLSWRLLAQGGRLGGDGQRNSLGTRGVRFPVASRPVAPHAKARSMQKATCFPFAAHRLDILLKRSGEVAVIAACRAQTDSARRMELNVGNVIQRVLKGAKRNRRESPGLGWIHGRVWRNARLISLRGIVGDHGWLPTRFDGPL